MTQERMTSAAFRARQGLPPPGTVAGVVQVSKAKPQIRIPAPRKMTKVEQEWMQSLQSRYPRALVAFEPFTLRLPSGTKYTADLVVIDRATGRVHEIHEVKGPHIHNPASIRAFKEAKAAFPFWTFIFAQKRKDGWTSTEDEPPTTP